MKEIITIQDLKSFFPSVVTDDELITLTKEVNHYCKNAICKIERERKEQTEYEKAKRAKRDIEKAINSLEDAKNWFSSEEYKKLIDDPQKKLEPINFFSTTPSQLTFINLCASILSFLPNQRPKSIEKRAYEQLFERIYTSCHRIDPSISWYKYDDVSGEYSGKFLEICKLIASKNNFALTDSVINKYLKTTVKPGRDKMKKVIKEIKKKQDVTGLSPLLIASNKTMMDKIYEEVEKK